jgi:hypothetical protein
LVEDALYCSGLKLRCLEQSNALVQIEGIKRRLLALGTLGEGLMRTKIQLTTERES